MSATGIPIEGFTKDGKSIGTFASAAEAARSIGTIATNISGCVNGNRHSAGGYRWRLVEEDASTISDAIQRHSLEDTTWSSAWIKEKGISLLVKNPNAVSNDTVNMEEIMADFREKMTKYTPKYPKIRRDKLKEGHLLVIDPADLHIGKLGADYENYNSDKAVKLAIEGVEGLMRKASGYEIDKIVLVIGNDVLHTDNARRTTTSGTPQDTDRSWYENYTRARDLYVHIIESLMTIADVHIVHCPSNHDYITGTLLAETVYAWFHKSKNVTFDIGLIHRKYYKYGNSLISLSHGDGAKLDQTPLLMAEEAKQDWADTAFRYIYLHHIHHKQTYKFKASQDFPGVSVEFLRSPSGTDRWHKDNGYTGAIRAIEGFIHSKTHGQVARLSHTFTDE